MRLVCLLVELFQVCVSLHLFEPSFFQTQGVLQKGNCLSCGTSTSDLMEGQLFEEKTLYN